MRRASKQEHRRSPNRNAGDIHTHLLAISGKRPAILTSTIWALAHLTPPIIPDRITVLTTATGREAIRRELFSSVAPGRPCVWEALRNTLVKEGFDIDGRLRFGDTGEDLRVFTIPGKGNRSLELEDLRSAEDYEQAADLLLDVLRSLTEVDETRLIACVSGGRKPLASLLASAMGLLGRPQDRLVHALVNEPFENPSLKPPLYFPPAPAIEHRYFDRALGKEQSISSAAAKVDLSDVPFVRLRRLFSKVPQLYRSRYSALVRAYDNRLSELAGPVEIGFDDSSGTLSVNGQLIELHGREHPFFAFIHSRWRRGESPFASQKSADEPLRRFLNAWSESHPAFNFERDGRDWRHTAETSDIARMLNALRTRLEGVGLTAAAERLFPRSGPAGIPLSTDIVPPPIEK